MGWQPTGSQCGLLDQAWGVLGLYVGPVGRSFGLYVGTLHIHAIPKEKVQRTMMKNKSSSQDGKQETSIVAGWSHANPACSFPTVASLGVDFDRLRAEKGRRSTWAMLQSCTDFSETDLDVGFGEMHNHIIQFLLSPHVNPDADS